MWWSGACSCVDGCGVDRGEEGARLGEKLITLAAASRLAPLSFAPCSRRRCRAPVDVVIEVRSCGFDPPPVTSPSSFSLPQMQLTQLPSLLGAQQVRHGRHHTGEMDEDIEVRDIGSGNFGVGVARLMSDRRSMELVDVKYIERGEKVTPPLVLFPHPLCPFLSMHARSPLNRFGGV